MREAHAPEQVFEPRVGAQAVEFGIDFEVDQVSRPLPEGLPEPGDRRRADVTGA